MKTKRFAAVLLSVILILSMLPVTAFAAADTALGGKIKISGEAKEGETLKADLSKVTPEGIKEADLDFKWVKASDTKEEDKETDTFGTAKDKEKALGTEASLKLTKEMVGVKIRLEISPKKDSGLTGDTLKSDTVTVKEASSKPEEPTETPKPTEAPVEEPIEQPMEEQEEPGEQVEVAEPLQEVVPAPVILTDTLPAITQEEEYRVQLQADSASGVTWGVKQGEGQLPEGLSLSLDGVLEGQTRIEAGTYSFVVTAANEGGTAERTLLLEVKAKEVEKVYSMKAEPDEISFGKLKEGYKEAEGKKVTLSNTGNVKLTFREMKAVNFQVKSTEGNLEPGSQLILTIEPKSGLAKGVYAEKLEFITDEDLKVEVTAAVEVVAAEEEKYEITVSPAEYDFGEKSVGYESAPNLYEFVVTNTGNQKVTLVQPEAKSFAVTKLNALELEPGAKAAFSVQPKKDLSMGTYEEKIDIATKEVAGGSVKVKFKVTGQKLLSIIGPKAITGIVNGTQKTAKALGLPETVQIKTNAGGKSAVVTWNVDAASYNPDSVEAQNFTVDGKITLPENVENPDQLALYTQVQVSVKAYVPKVPDTSELKIQGVSSNSTYKTNTAISFSAVGASAGTPLRKGDARYVPYAWKLGANSYTTFADTNYKAELKSSNAGTYTLTVSYRKDVYDGKEWKSDGTMAYKEVSLKFIKDTVTITPAVKNNNTKKNPVETGDETNVAGWILLAGGAALVCAVGLVVIKRRRKRG